MGQGTLDLKAMLVQVDNAIQYGEDVEHFDREADDEDDEDVINDGGACDDGGPDFEALD